MEVCHTKNRCRYCDYTRKSVNIVVNGLRQKFLITVNMWRTLFLCHNSHQ